MLKWKGAKVCNPNTDDDANSAYCLSISGFDHDNEGWTCGAIETGEPR